MLDYSFFVKFSALLFMYEHSTDQPLCDAVTLLWIIDAWLRSSMMPLLLLLLLLFLFCVSRFFEYFSFVTSAKRVKTGQTISVISVFSHALARAL